MLERPAFKPHLHVEVVSNEGIVLLSETQQFILPGRVYALVAPHLDGRQSPHAIAAALRGEVEPAKVFDVLDDLDRQGHLFDSDGALPADAAWWTIQGVDPTRARERLAHGTVAVHALGGVTSEPLLAAMRSVGVVARPEGRRHVVLTDDYLRPELERINREALAAEREWLLVKPVGCVLWLGPVFRPGRNACWECLAQRLRLHRGVERSIARGTGAAPALVLARASSPAAEQCAATLAAAAIAAWVARDESPELDGTDVTVDVQSVSTAAHRVVWRPQCPVCGDPAEGVEVSPRPIVLAGGRKAFTLDGGHRVRTPDATLERYQHHVSPISGVVGRIARQGTSRDGAMPAYLAGANLSRPARSLGMLSEGLRSRIGGKGMTEAQARASALCEALERYSGVFHGDEPRRQARRAELGAAAIHPNDCMGFSARQYRDRESWNARGELTQAVPLPFDDPAGVAWTPVWSLSRGETRYLPTAFCFYEYPALPEAAMCIACSNGNAAGNTLEEAILQGVLELVERDSVALWWYSRAVRPGVALDSFDEPYLRTLEAYLARHERDLAVIDLTADLEIPVFAAISRRPGRSPEQIVFGFGAHLDARIAVLRAVAELNQMLMRLLWGDGREGTRLAPRSEPGVDAWLRTATLGDHPHVAPDPTLPPRRAGEYPRRWSDDLRDDIRLCQALVEGKGMELLVLDQTRPDVGLPVVKVIVPGLRHFWRRLAPGRLYDVPVALGWVAAPLREEQLNPTSMFL